MPTKCCVPFCRSNYDSQKQTVSMFTFPLEPERRQLWIDSIAREDLKNPSKYQAVCMKHFCDHFIIRVDSIPLSDGSILSVKRRIPKLTKDAYPSLFPERPAEPPMKKKRPNRPKPKYKKCTEKRQLDGSTCTDESRSKSIVCLKPISKDLSEQDKIINFFDFMANFNDKKSNQWINKLHMKDGTVQYMSFYCLLDTYVKKENGEQEGPSLLSAIRIFNDMHVEVYTKNGARVPFNKLKGIFITQDRPVLRMWSQFDALLLQFSACKAEVEDEETQEEMYTAEGTSSEPKLALSKSLFLSRS